MNVEEKLARVYITMCKTRDREDPPIVKPLEELEMKSAKKGIEYCTDLLEKVFPDLKKVVND